MMESISDIFSGKEITQAPAETVEVKDDKPAEQATATPSVAQEPEKVQIRDESGKFVKAEADKPAPVIETKVEKPTGQIAAMLAERRKRQELEAELAQLRAGKPADAPDFYADPDKAVEARVQKVVEPIRTAFFKQSIERAEAKHSDYAEVVEAFEKLIENNPRLRSEWVESDDPGEFLYSVGTNTPEHREKFATELKGQLSKKDEQIAALAAELEALKKSQAEIASIPSSLNRKGSAPVKPGDGDEEDIASIVKFNQRKLY